MNRPALGDLKRWLDDRLAASLGERFGKLDISLLSQANSVADGTTVLLLRDAMGQSRAVVLCAAPASPELVQRAVHRARQAKMILGPSLGAHILDPLMEGSVQGLSYAVMPYCNSLSNFRPVWWIQRALLRPSILEWLLRVTECTVHDVEPADIERSFAAPLRVVAELNLLNGRLRAAAERAAERLHGGEWSPKFVLMHGDFWKGNILIRPKDHAGEKQQWRDRFIIIDWPGSAIRGYAIFDLIRMSQSMRLNTRNLRREIAGHCQLLKCKVTDSMSYLLAGLGHVAMSLEHFPVDAYARMADSCFATLKETLD